VSGIAGLLDVEGIGEQRADFGRAVDAAAHRGPDGRGLTFHDYRSPGGDRTTHVGATLALGHRRGGGAEADPEPLSSEDGTLTLVMDGRLENAAELRGELRRAGCRFVTASEAEVVLGAYETWGSAAVGRFEGVWALAVADLRRRILFCSRDRFGVRPLHYHAAGGRFSFASEIRQLLVLRHVPRRVNRAIVHDYLAGGLTDHTDATFFDEIRSLPPGHNLTVPLDDARPVVERWYRPSFTVDRGISPGDAAGEFRRLLEASLRRSLEDGDGAAFCLTGGVDSAALACLAGGISSAARGRSDRRFFAIVPEDGPEVQGIIEETASAAGGRVCILRPSPEELVRELDELVQCQEEPVAGPDVFFRRFLLRGAREAKIPLIVLGVGCAEILAGDPHLAGDWLRELREKGLRDDLTREIAGLRRRHPELFPGILPTGGVAGVLRKVLHPDRRPPLDWIAPGLASSGAGAGLTEPGWELFYGPEEFLNNALARLTFRTGLPALLRGLDRSSAARSVECRYPFLDHPLVEFVLRLPGSMKIGDGFTVRLLREAMKGVVPEVIRLEAAGRERSPAGPSWWKTVIRSLAAAVLEDERMREFIDPVKARRWHARILALDPEDPAPWRWVCLQRWLREFQR
jgi:asparagine synthase (glutamine-hydrolysing)